MLTVKRIVPFYMKKQDSRYYLVFAYQYFSIIKDGRLFQFVPTEGKRIIINAYSLQVENLGEVFVFQNGDTFLRLPLYQLLLISDLHVYLSTILEGDVAHMDAKLELSKDVLVEARELIEELEQENRMRMIDYALETNDVTLFQQLAEGLQEI